MDNYRKIWSDVFGPIPKGFHVHHIIPQCEGGKDVIGNLIALHPDDHILIHKMRGDKWHKTVGWVNLANKATSKPCIVKGVKFASMRQAAEHFGCSHVHISRYLSGDTSKEGFLKGSDHGRSAKPCEIDGVKFSSRLEAAEHFGVHWKTVSRWCVKGTRNKLHAVKSCVIKGKSFKTQKDAAEYFGVVPSTINRWIKQQ